MLRKTFPSHISTEKAINLIWNKTNFSYGNTLPAL